MVKLCWLLGIVAGLIFFSVPVVAGDKKGSQIVISDQEAGTVVVKPPKPEVWYLLPRSKLGFESEKQEKKLVPKIDEAIQKSPF